MSIIAQAQARVKWQRQQDVPLGGHYDVFKVVGGEYTQLNPLAIPAWPDGTHKRGWGLGPWGLGRWGYGIGQGAGWGLGPWGLGAWGFGIPSMMAYVTPELPDGTYTLAVIGADEAGNQSATADETAQVQLAGTPDPIPLAPTADAYDDGSDTLTISWAQLSPDDEAA